MKLLLSLLVASLLLGAVTQDKLPPSDWAQIRAEYHRHRHAFVKTKNGYAARNPANGWVAKLDGTGFTLDSDKSAWQWGLDLRTLSGRTAIPGSKPTISRNTLTYRRGEQLDEWFANRPSGLEHGYTVHSRPQGGLTFRFAVRGDLRASGSGEELCLTRDGVAVLTYSGLKAWDANRRALPARMTGFGDRIELVVDDSGAQYPVTVDPTVQQAYLKASNTSAEDGFGYSVAVSGDTAIVGSPGEDSSATGVNGDQTSDAAPGSGAAYVFVRSGGTWVQQAYLKASNTGGGFGIAVSLSGDTAIVGAPGAAAAYIFVRSGTDWSQQAFLKASNSASGDRFGISVAISGNTAVVGADGEESFATGVNGDQADNSAPFSGAAYVFARSGMTWQQQAYLKASNTETGDYFGYSVAISGDVAVVGAYREDSFSTGPNPNQADNASPQSGAAFVFVRAGTAWSQQAYLKASNPGVEDYFGYSVAVSGNTVVVGAHREDSGSTGVNGDQESNEASNSGAAYVFTRTGTTWSQQAYIKAPNTGVDDSFGYSVAVFGDLMVIGAPGEASHATGVNGNQIDNTASLAGAAYVFTRSGTTWTLASYLKASNTDPFDNFGGSVGVGTDAVVVGAPSENSRATGVNVNQTDNSAWDAGAVYAFQLGLINPSRIGTFTSGIWALDLNGNYFNEGAAPDRNTLFSLGSSAESPVMGDWNGDGKMDAGVYLNGTWQIDANGNGVWDGPVTDKLIFFGGPGYAPYVGDWNGDGRTDIAVHQDGTWLIDFNGNFAWDGTSTDKLIFFGGLGYAPYIGKWGTSSNSSIAVHSNGTWLIDLNGNFQWDGPAIDGYLHFGGAGYTPVTGDWNGDGRTDLAAYLNGTWIVDLSGNYSWDGITIDRLIHFGGTGFIPVSGDWNGDGKDKVGGFSAGTWVLDRNGNYAWDGGVTDVVTTYGTTGSVPVPGKWQ